MTFNKSFKQDAVIEAQSGLIDAGANTGGYGMPSGTTEQRPLNPSNGMIRYNTSTNSVEGYISNAWVVIKSGAYRSEERRVGKECY
jgi:hypothetical protein